MTRPARYRLYGLVLRSAVALPAPLDRATGPADVRLVRAPASRFVRARHGARGKWFAYRRTGHGDFYLRWMGLVECLAARDGRTVWYRPLPGSTDEALIDYVLGTVLSFPLMARGVEPLHATTVLVGGRAVGFLGDCGTGKSTLAAAMLAGGHRLLTDDLLSLSNGAHRFVAHPGPTRIKLFPEVARALLARSDGSALNAATRKRVLPLSSRLASRRPAPLAVLYCLKPSTAGSAVRIEPLTGPEALIEIVRGAFNLLRTDAARLGCQFAFAAALAAAVPVRRLLVPRRLSALPAVRDAIERDLRER